MEEDGESEEQSAAGIDQEPSFDSDGEKTPMKKEPISSSDEQE